MLRHKPTFRYSGLTIILSSGSRFDRTELLTGVAGHWFNKECLEPDTSRYNCDIRLVDDKSPLLDNTKCIMLLGQKALSQYTGAITSIDENRGSPIISNSIPCIASFSPQDAMDLKNFEKAFNEKNQEDEDDEVKQDEIFESKGRGRTSRENYRFWLKQDTKKALRIVNNNGLIPKLYDATPNYIICPDLHSVVNYLTHNKNQDLYFDCETDFISLDIRCFSFSFSDSPFDIYCVPFLTTDYRPFYGDSQHLLWKALLIAIRDNTLVAHNGAHFDFFVLAYKLGIPIGKVYDTMVSHHRLYPTIEKSLGHCVSLCTYEPYHKNEGVHAFRNWDQAMQLMAYCGKDVFTMYLVKKWQEEMASRDEGLRRSIELANAAIKPYLTSCLAGMNYNETARQNRIAEGDKLMTFYMKIMRLLTGDKVEPLISNKKCTKYFHEQMEYGIEGRTKSGNASLAAENLLKLGLKHDNPVIKFLIKYRETQKETSTLNFKPWRI